MIVQAMTKGDLSFYPYGFLINKKQTSIVHQLVI
jgi:hypothetical protein